MTTGSMPLPSGSTASFEGSVSIVTGAGQGIGEAVARGLAARGSHVVIADVRADPAEAVAEGIRNDGSSATAVTVDVTSTREVNELVRRALTITSRIDVLVNAAGGFPGPSATEQLSDDEWARGLDLNLGSVFRCCRAVIPAMKQARAGRIVNVASEAGRMPIALSTAYYVAAKAGVIGLTRHLARELGPHGVTCNAVAPGTTLTPRVESLHSDETTERIIGLTPLGRLADTSDQVGPILFLASDEARYITGATLDVNGGRLML